MPADVPTEQGFGLWIIPIKYTLDLEGKQVVMEVLADGTVTGKGAPIAKIVGRQIQSPTGQTLVAVDLDGVITGPRAPAGAHFDAKHRIVTDVATLGVARDEMVDMRGPRGRKPVQASAVATDFGQVQVAVQWSGGKKQALVGYFDHYEWRARSEVALLSMLFLMKPDALTHVPEG